MTLGKNIYSCLLSYNENSYMFLLLITTSKPIYPFQIAMLEHCNLISKQLM